MPQFVAKGFDQVVLNYRKLRDTHKPRGKVRGILALTMADDPRTGYDDLRDRWVTPYMDAPRHYLRDLSTGHGVARLPLVLRDADRRRYRQRSTSRRFHLRNAAFTSLLHSTAIAQMPNGIPKRQQGEMPGINAKTAAVMAKA